MNPHRIQRRRDKGWRMPPGAVYVGRGSKWGNPFVCHPDRGPSGKRWPMTAENAVACFRRQIENAGGWYPVPLPWPKGKMPAGAPTTVEDVRRELRGKTLACWCRLDESCHADVLLEIANSPPPSTDQSLKKEGYGDYVSMDVGADGIIANWKVKLCDFESEAND